MDMFDSVPGITLAGEHGGLLNHEMGLFEDYIELSKRGAHAWKHEAADRHAILCNIQEFTKRLIFGATYESGAGYNSKILGFKEIRYARKNALRFFSK
eukprot:scaffold449714_cov40-Prasinocladus_malaysianus.AAC.1